MVARNSIYRAVLEDVRGIRRAKQKPIVGVVEADYVTLMGALRLRLHTVHPRVPYPLSGAPAHCPSFPAL
jgi:hypothetical protein